MSETLFLILLAFAVYRLSWMTAIDIGPFAIFDNIRLLFITKFNDKDWVVEGANCPFCHSVWYAAIAAILMHPGTIIDYIVLWIGIAGMALVLIAITKGLTRQ